MIDTHAHLDACDDPPELLVQRADDVGVTRVITVGAGIDSCHRAVELAHAYEGIFAALGVDPHRAAGDEAGRLDELRGLLPQTKVVAVGETGLDFHWGRETKAAQARLFHDQLELARESGLPVVIHCREAARQTADILAGFDGTVVLHCFSEPDLLPTALERGYYVAFAGNVSYPKRAELRAAAAVVPADRILAETDSPYLSPQPRRGRPNEPANVIHTVSALAEARGEDPAELAAAIDLNATAAFGL